ncbi:helix-turn-helix transcriptional regulator [Bifidobacterium apicola]|uniref:helix-turn-helix transcriptional regulator n=1 Tax=Bifidobacterium apicola TaxID=3230739 RepID=UPI0036F302D6
MSFRTNVQYLRSQRNMTQEQLAMLVGVSRQAVSKWESDKAYPEMDKLLAICDLFGCTLDDLVLGDVRHPGSGQHASVADHQEPAQTALTAHVTMPVQSAMEDVTGYASFSNAYSLRMAFGIALIMLGLAFSGLFAAVGQPTDAQKGLAFLALMIGIVLGLACLILASSARRDFRRRHPYVADFYTNEERSRVYRQTTWELVCGLAVVLLDVGLNSAGFLIWGWSNQVRGFVFFLLLALGIFLLVHAGTVHRMMNLRAYNRQTDSADDVRGDAYRYEHRISNAISGTVMGLCTLVALTMLFSGNYDNLFGWRIPFWAIWIIGGVFCGVLQSLIGIFRRPPRA